MKDLNFSVCAKSIHMQLQEAKNENMKLILSVQL